MNVLYIFVIRNIIKVFYLYKGVYLWGRMIFYIILSNLMVTLQIMYYLNEAIVDLTIKHYISVVISIIFIVSDLVLIFIWFSKSINKTFYFSYIHTNSFLNKLLLSIGLAIMIIWIFKLCKSINKIRVTRDKEE